MSKFRSIGLQESENSAIRQHDSHHSQTEPQKNTKYYSKEEAIELRIGVSESTSKESAIDFLNTAFEDPSIPLAPDGALNLAIKSLTARAESLISAKQSVEFLAAPKTSIVKINKHRTPCQSEFRDRISKRESLSFSIKNSLYPICIVNNSYWRIILTNSKFENLFAIKETEIKAIKLTIGKLIHQSDLRNWLLWTNSQKFKHKTENDFKMIDYRGNLMKIRIIVFKSDIFSRRNIFLIFKPI